MLASSLLAQCSHFNIFSSFDIHCISQQGVYWKTKPNKCAFLQVYLCRFLVSFDIVPKIRLNQEQCRIKTSSNLTFSYELYFHPVLFFTSDVMKGHNLSFGRKYQQIKEDACLHTRSDSREKLCAKNKCFHTNW